MGHSHLCCLYAISRACCPTLYSTITISRHKWNENMILQWTVRLSSLDLNWWGGCGPSGPRSNWASHRNGPLLCSLEVTLRLMVNDTFTGLWTRLVSQGVSFWGWQSVTCMAPDEQMHILERRLEEQRHLAWISWFQSNQKYLFHTHRDCCLPYILGLEVILLWTFELFDKL